MHRILKITAIIFVAVGLLTAGIWYFLDSGNNWSATPAWDATSKGELPPCTAAQLTALGTIPALQQQANTFNSEADALDYQNLSNIQDNWQNDPTGKTTYEQQIQPLDNQAAALEVQIQTITGKNYCAQPE